MYCTKFGIGFHNLSLQNAVSAQGGAKHLNLHNVCLYLCLAAYTSFYILGLVCSMQIPFVGFQPIRTSEHMASAGECLVSFSHDLKTLTVKNLHKN